MLSTRKRCCLHNLSFWWRALLTRLVQVLCSLVNLSFWWRALLTDWCGPVQSCQPLFLVESIAYRLVQSLDMHQSCQHLFLVESIAYNWCCPVHLSTIFLVESIAYRLVRSCAVLSTSLSGGEHCLPIGAVLCSLVNISFWWRALLTDWCGPVQTCQPHFLVESIAYQIGAVLCSLVNLSFWWRALLTRLVGPVQSCQPLFLVESIAYQIGAVLCSLSTSLSGGEHCSPPERDVDKTAQDLHQSCQAISPPVESIAYRLVQSCAVLSTISFWWRALLTRLVHSPAVNRSSNALHQKERLTRLQVLSTSLSGGEHCLQIGASPVQSNMWRALLTRLVQVLSTSLSGGEHCLPIGAVLCSLVNISFWWRALLTDWCGPVQSCQPLFLVESIAYRLVRSCAVLSTSLSGGEHCLPERDVDKTAQDRTNLVSNALHQKEILHSPAPICQQSLSGGEHCLQIGAVLCSLVNNLFLVESIAYKIGAGPVQSCQGGEQCSPPVESITYRLVRSCAILSMLSFWWRALLTDWCGPVPIL